MSDKYSIMLGQIASEVEDFCIHEECSTLDAVRILKAEHAILKAEKDLREIEAKYEPEK